MVTFWFDDGSVLAQFTVDRMGKDATLPPDCAGSAPVSVSSCSSLARPAAAVMCNGTTSFSACVDQAGNTWASTCADDGSCQCTDSNLRFSGVPPPAAWRGVGTPYRNNSARHQSQSPPSVPPFAAAAAGSMLRGP